MTEADYQSARRLATQCGLVSTQDSEFGEKTIFRAAKWPGDFFIIRKRLRFDNQVVFG
jgi:hypothetical protein